MMVRCFLILVRTAFFFGFELRWRGVIKRRVVRSGIRSGDPKMDAERITEEAFQRDLSLIRSLSFGSRGNFLRSLIEKSNL